MSKTFKNYFGSVEHSISKRLLRSVLSIYFILTLIVTAVHIAIEYYSAKESVQNVLSASEKTFHDILAADMWNYNHDQLAITAGSMMRLPFVRGVEVIVPEDDLPMFSRGITMENKDGSEGLFWHEFDLSYSEYEVNHLIGNVRIYSDSSVVIDQIESGLYTLIINAIIKTLALVVLVMVVFNRLLTRPLGKLAKHAEAINIEKPVYKPINVAENSKDELGLMQRALNRMMKKTTETIQKLDSINKELEKRVTERTQALRETLAQLDQEHVALKNEVESRKKSEQALAKSLEQLQQTQTKLVASEKMASLGVLASGVAHEINSPISFVLQNVVVLGEYNDVLHTLIKDYKAYVEAINLEDGGEAPKENSDVIRTRIEKYEAEEDLEFIVSDSLSLLESTRDGITRVIDIVKNMKTFSHVDADAVHSVDVHELLDSTLQLLKREIPANIQIEKALAANLYSITCNRNELGQVFLNLIMNALQAIDDKKEGIIYLSTESKDAQIAIHIMDNGCGISDDHVNMIFDPFYTTKDVGEGMGMGLSIAYGIVKKHNGEITVSSIQGKGSKFTVKFPIDF